MKKKRLLMKIFIVLFAVALTTGLGFLVSPEIAAKALSAEGGNRKPEEALDERFFIEEAVPATEEETTAQDPVPLSGSTRERMTKRYDTLYALREKAEKDIFKKYVSPAPPKKETQKSSGKTTQPANPYSIMVSKKLNYVVVYQSGVPLRAFICSTGNHGEGTPTGTFAISNKYIWRELFGGVYGQYAMRIVGTILFHSVPYLSPSPAALETAEYNKLGSAASAGCVRMTVAACKWIYYTCPSGTPVTIVDDDRPCPLPIEGAPKIPAGCTWDPTDEAAGNPWYGYKPPAPKEPEPEEDDETSSTEGLTSEKDPDTASLLSSAEEAAQE